VTWKLIVHVYIRIYTHRAWVGRSARAVSEKSIDAVSSVSPVRKSDDK
jgi:hypothetical protein